MKLSNSYIPLLVLFVSIQLISFSTAPQRKFSPPHGRTGAPGDLLCSDACHIQNDPDATDQVTDGSLELLGIPTIIEPNTTYSISIKLENLSQHGKIAGFQLVALDGNENTSISTGTFSNFGERVEASSGGSNPNRVYLRHDDNALLFGDQGFPLNRIIYTADWTSPATISSPIYFYAAGVIGNNNNSNQGDLVKTYTTVTAPLPLELISFHAQQSAKQEVTIAWETASENNTSYFEILRSSNGKDYTSLGKIPAAGFSNHNISYTYIDKKPLLNKTTFYRLKQVDIDGTFVYSSIHALEVLDFTKNEMSILPNPIQQNEYIFVDFLATKDYPKAKIEIFDTMGRKLNLKEVLPNGLTEGFNKIIVDTANLPTGIYFLNVHDGQKVLANQTVIVK